jgi:photosystem II stability/assembly factor-like uncharacterized protein
LLGVFLCGGCQKEKWHVPVFQEQVLPVHDDLASVWFIDSLTGYAVGGTPWMAGFVLSTRDGGASWQTDTTLNRKLECIMFDPSGHGYACGQDLAIFKSPGDTRHWESFEVSFRWGRACFFPDPTHGMVVFGESYRDGQAHIFGPQAFWQRDTNIVFTNELASVWFADSTTACAVGLGWVTRTTDRGHTWTRADITGDFFNCVRFPTPETGYICGHSGSILKTTDKGQNWQTIRKGGSVGAGNQPFTAMWFETAEKGWIVGESSLFWRTVDGGASWQQVTGIPDNMDFTGICTRNGHGWITAKGGHIFYFQE